MVQHQRQSPVLVTVKFDRKVAHASFQAGRRPARKLVLLIGQNVKNNRQNKEERGEMSFIQGTRTQGFETYCQAHF